MDSRMGYTHGEKWRIGENYDRFNINHITIISM